MTTSHRAYKKPVGLKVRFPVGGEGAGLQMNPIFNRPHIRG